MKKETERLILGLIIGSVVTALIFLSLNSSKVIQNACNNAQSYQSSINQLCSNENKHIIEFEVDTSDIFQYLVSSESCYTAYREKFGTNPSGTCLLKSATTAQMTIGFLSGYTCWCWN